MKRTISLLLSLLMIFSTVVIYNVSAEMNFMIVNILLTKKMVCLLFPAMEKCRFIITKLMAIQKKPLGIIVKSPLRKSL